MKDIVMVTGVNGMKAWYEAMDKESTLAGPGILSQISTIKKPPLSDMNDALRKLRKYGTKDIMSDLELAAVMLNEEKYKGVEGKELKYVDGEWTVVDTYVEKTPRVSLKFVTT